MPRALSASTTAVGEMSALEEVVAQLLERQPAPLLRPLHLQALWWAVERAHRALLATPAAAPLGSLNPQASGEGPASEGAAGSGGAGRDGDVGPEPAANPGNPDENPASAAEGALRELRGGLELLAMVAARRPEVIGERLPLLLKVGVLVIQAAGKSVSCLPHAVFACAF